MNSTIILSSVGMLLLCLLLAPLGCFLMWKRLTFLADTMSHSSILGVAIGILLNISTSLSLILFLILLTLCLKFMISRTTISKDSSLSLISYGGMSIGILILSSYGKSDLITQFLFGDILSIEDHELIILFITLLVSSLFIILFHKKLIQILINKNLAYISKIKVDILETSFMLIIALAIGFSMKLAGALTITALLIIPSIATKNISQSYKQMLIFSTAFSITLCPVAIFLILKNDVQTGPVTVCTFIAGLVCLTIAKKTYSFFLKAS